VAAEVTHLRIVEQLISTTVRDSHPAHLLAAATTTRHRSSNLCATYAKSPDANEYSAGQCDQRSEWGDRTADGTGHRCRRARPPEARGTQSSADSSQPGRDCQKPGGQLAPGTDLRV